MHCLPSRLILRPWGQRVCPMPHQYLRPSCISRLHGLPTEPTVCTWLQRMRHVWCRDVYKHPGASVLQSWDMQQRRQYGDRPYRLQLRHSAAGVWLSRPECSGERQCCATRYPDMDSWDHWSISPGSCWSSWGKLLNIHTGVRDGGEQYVHVH